MTADTKTFEPRRSETPARGAFGEGLSAGLFAGCISLLVQMLGWGLAGLGFWLPLKAKAAAWLGVEALVGGFGAVLVGLLTHLTASGLWGLVFASFVGPRLVDRRRIVGVPVATRSMTGSDVDLAARAALVERRPTAVRYRARGDQPVVAGIAFGFVAWAVMVLLVVPAFDPALSVRIGFTPGWWFLSYLVYGAVLGALVRRTRAPLR